MTRVNDESPTPLLIFYRVLGILAGILGFLILVGTLYAFFLRPAQKGAGAPAVRTVPGTVPGTAQGTAPDAAPGTQYFTGIGRVRAATADAQPAAVILSVTFPYDRSDLAFSEELAARVKDLRDLTVDLLSEFSAERLRLIEEQALKAELLRRYNGMLRLGAIKILYFNDYLIIE